LPQRRHREDTEKTQTTEETERKTSTHTKKTHREDTEKTQRGHKEDTEKTQRRHREDTEKRGWIPQLREKHSFPFDVETHILFVLFVQMNVRREMRE